MELSIVIKGLFIGFTGAAVLGPIGVIIIQRTLKNGWKTAIPSGLGVAIADGLYGLIGGLGLTVITSFMVGQQTWLRIIGGAVLVIIGFNAIKAKTNMDVKEERKQHTLGFIGDFSSIFLLTISNPMTILYFSGVYAGIGLSGVEGGLIRAVFFSLGVTFGSLVWWMVLAGGVDILRTKFNEKLLQNFSRFSGLIIAIFGIGIILSAL